MNANLLRTPGTASLTGCARQRARPAFRQQSFIVESIPCSVCFDEKHSADGLVSRTTRHQRRSCQTAAVAMWACTPLFWLKNQVSKEIWIQITRSLCAVTAFVGCMLLSVMVFTTMTIIRFQIRERRRATAIAKRRAEALQWCRRRVRRALVLAQDISDFRLVDKYISARLAAMEASRGRLMATHHARSLACTASPVARNTRHLSGRMMVANFRDFVRDNWRMSATGNALYTTIHDQPSAAPQDAPNELYESRQNEPRPRRQSLP